MAVEPAASPKAAAIDISVSRQRRLRCWHSQTDVRLNFKYRPARADKPSRTQAASASLSTNFLHASPQRKGYGKTIKCSLSSRLPRWKIPFLAVEATIITRTLRKASSSGGFRKLFVTSARRCETAIRHDSVKAIGCCPFSTSTSRTSSSEHVWPDTEGQLDF